MTETRRRPETAKPVATRRPAADDAADAPVDPEQQQQIRIAWAYFVEGLTQAEIAERLGLTRLRVNRILQICRETGIIQIRIQSPLASCVALERALIRRYGLRDAVVVPTPQDEDKIRAAIGVALGAYVENAVHDGMLVGIGWGQTLRLGLQSMKRRRMTDLSVVSLIGSMTRGSGQNTFEIVSRFADLHDADRFYFAAPVYADDEAQRDSLLGRGVLRDIYDKAKSADLALISVGNVSDHNLMLALGIVDREAAALRAAGAVGDVLGNWLDAAGRPVDHPLNRRTVALGLDDLARIPSVVLASGGSYKFEIIRAALRRRCINVLITDEALAERLAEDREG